MFLEVMSQIRIKTMSQNAIAAGTNITKANVDVK